MDTVSVENYNFTENDLTSVEQIIFYNYWLIIKGERVMPKRTDFDPMQIPKVLPYILMEDVLHDPLKFKIRLIGSKLKIPITSKEKTLDQFPNMKSVVGLLTRMADQKKPCFYKSKSHWSQNSYEEYTSLILPFSDENEKINIIMGCQSMLML